MSALGKIAKVGAVAGVAAFAAAVAVGAEELKQQAAVSAQTATVLRNLGRRTDVTAGQVEGLATALQAQTGAADDQVQAASNMILRFGLVTKSGKAAEDQLRQMTTTALDLSVATGKNLTSSTMALGRALADPTKAAGALRRAGVVLTESQKDQIKSMVESGRVGQAQAKVLELVESRVKGSAKAFGQSIPGQVERAKRAFEDFSENALVALAPAVSKILPPLVSVLDAIAPVVAEFASGIGDAITALSNDAGIRSFAAAVRDLAIGGFRLVLAAGQALLPIVSGIASVLGGLAGVIQSNAAAMLLFSSAVGALVAAGAAAYIQKLVRSFVELAAVQRAITGFSALSTAITGLAPAVSVLAGGLSKTSAASVGLAPGLTAAAAGMSRFGAAGSIAKTALSGIGTSLMAAAGGPIGVATLAVGALVGGVVALASGMFSGKSANEVYADTLRNVANAASATRSAISGVRSAVIDAARAELDLKDATARRAEAAIRVSQAEAQFGPRSAQAAQARRDLARAELDVASARDRSISAQNRQTSSLDTLRNRLSVLPGKMREYTQGIRDQMAAQSRALMFGQVTRAEYDKMSATLNKKLNAPKELASVQKEARETAGALKGVTGPAAKAARDALEKVANFKVGKGGDIGPLKKLVDQATAKLDALKKKTSGTKGQTDSNLKGIGAGAAGSVSGNMAAIFSAVQTTGQDIIDEARRIHEEASAELAQTGKRSVPVVPSIRNNLRAAAGAVETGGREMVRRAKNAHEDASKILARVGAGVKSVLNSGTKKQDSARNQKFGEVFRNAAPNISSRLSADTFARDKGTSGNNGIRLVKSKFSDLQGELDGALKAIDTRLDGALKSIETNLNDQGNAIEKALQGALVDNLDAIIPAYADRIRSIKAQSDVLKGLESSLTAEEEALKNFDAAGAASDLSSRISDAQAKLQEARDYGSAADVAAAEKELGDAQRAQQRANLEASAAESRRLRDEDIATKRAQMEADAEWVRTKIATDAENARIAQQQQAEADRVATQAIYEARRLEMEAELARMEAQFARIPALLKANNPQARKELKAIKDSFAKFGYGAGDVFVEELGNALDGMGAVISKKLAKQIKPYLELNSPAKAGPLSELDKWFVPFSDTLLGGIDMREAEKTADGIASMLSPSGSISGAAKGGTVVNVTVNGNEFSAREFARKLQPELDRIISYSGV